MAGNVFVIRDNSRCNILFS